MKLFTARQACLSIASLVAPWLLGCGGAVEPTTETGTGTAMGTGTSSGSTSSGSSSSGSTSSGSTSSGGGERRCTPGVYVYCRCEDGGEGSRQCNADGTDFAACVCS